MAGGIDWFRWHHGSVNDPKFQLVAKQAGAAVADVVAVWASLLEAASQAERRGNAGRPDFEAVDCALGLPDGRTEAIYVRLVARGMVGEDGSITAWDRRQPKREDESAADRKRRQRERDRDDDTQGHDASRSVTQQSRGVTQGHDREEESREERTTPLTPQGGETAQAKPARKSRGAKFAPADFEVSEDLKAWAQANAPLVDWRAETEKFRDWEFKHARTDWSKVWRTWMRKAQEGATQSRGDRSGSGSDWTGGAT